MSPVKPIPEGFHTITPHVTVKGAAKAIDFYKAAFGAEELGRHAMPDGLIMHATLKIGDSRLYLNDEFPDMGCNGPAPGGTSPVTLHLFVQDADKAWDRAVKAGASIKMPIADQFWGDRYGVLADPFGHYWSIGQRKQDLTSEQVMKAAAAAFGGH